MGSLDMKQIPCSGPGCSKVFTNHETDLPRGVKLIEVPDEYQGKAYCSIECKVYDDSGVYGITVIEVRD